MTQFELTFASMDENVIASVLNEMVTEIAKEEKLPVSIAINLVAKYYEVTRNKIKKYLRKINSDFVANNNVVIFDGEEPIRRTAAMAIMYKGLAKLKPLYLENKHQIEFTSWKNYIGDFYCKKGY